MLKFSWPRKVKEQKPLPAPTKSGVLGCQTCGLYSGCKTPQMMPHGEGRLKIAVVAEAPGAQEDLQGVQLIGDAGQLLRSELSRFSIDLDKDCIKSNSCRCRPPSNRKPTNLEIECCKRDVWSQIKEFQPKAIWLMGGASIKSFFWDFESGEPSINRWRGWAIPNHEFQAYIFPMYHPSYVLRNPKDQGLKLVFHQDIANAIKNLNRPFPKQQKPTVNKLTNKSDIETILRQANEDNRPFTFDYETTGLKPYRDGHSIVYAGFSRDGKEAWAFPFEGNEKYWKQILLNSEIPKVAHHMKFEELWSREILNVEVRNWIHCTMLCAHVLDDRSEITSLKFQIACRYGEMQFKDDSDPYLKAPHGNDFNNIRKAPLDLMLQRVGDDAGWEARLYYDQIKELKSVGNTGFQTLEYGYNFFHEGSLALVDAEQTGMKINEVYLVGKKDDPKDTGVKGKLEKEIAELKTSIIDNKYVKQFFGGKFNPKSDVQLKKLLYTDMKLKPTAFTAPTKAHPEGTPKVDKAALEWIAADKDHPMCEFVSDILQFKKQSTLHSTFVVGLMNEVWDNEVHSFYNLHLARTYRSTSNMPNFQNFPMRDKENSKLVRSAFYPYPGHQIMEADFSGLEVKISACHNRDPELIRYIKDETTDMHRDQASALFLLPQYSTDTWKESKALKTLRYNAKNMFVFPEFYGSWFGACANDLWNSVNDCTLADGTPVLEHLAQQRIRVYNERIRRFELKYITNLETYTSHVQAEEENFWERFKVYKAWKEEQLDHYYETGTVPMYFGFRRQGYLGKNKILNTSIQGTAFHCLLWCFVRLNNLRRKFKWKSLLCGQIHDSIVMSVHPDEKDMILKLINRIMTKDLVEAFNWIIVPMGAEIEMGEVNEPWSMKKEVKF